MKTKAIAISLMFILVFATGAIAGEQVAAISDHSGYQVNQTDQVGQNQSRNLICQSIEDQEEGLQSFELARSGCCSWHGGVCGCDEATDRIRCCDGTLSPTCRCSTY